MKMILTISLFLVGMAQAAEFTQIETLQGKTADAAVQTFLKLKTWQGEKGNHKMVAVLKGIQVSNEEETRENSIKQLIIKFHRDEVEPIVDEVEVSQLKKEGRSFAAEARKALANTTLSRKQKDLFVNEVATLAKLESITAYSTTHGNDHASCFGILLEDTRHKEMALLESCLAESN